MCGSWSLVNSAQVQRRKSRTSGLTVLLNADIIGTSSVSLRSPQFTTRSRNLSLLTTHAFRSVWTPHYSVPMSTISLKIEFGGGLELLFSNQRSHKITVPAHIPVSSSTSDASASEEARTKPADLTFLIFWLRDNLLKERAELFVENGTV